jgi:hypothetical protein
VVRFDASHAPTNDTILARTMAVPAPARARYIVPPFESVGVPVTGLRPGRHDEVEQMSRNSARK